MEEKYYIVKINYREKSVFRSKKREELRIFEAKKQFSFISGDSQFHLNLTLLALLFA